MTLLFVDSGSKAKGRKAPGSPVWKGMCSLLPGGWGRGSVQPSRMTLLAVSLGLSLPVQWQGLLANTYHAQGTSLLLQAPAQEPSGALLGYSPLPQGLSACP